MSGMPNWLRAIMITAGLVPLIIGVVILLYPDLVLKVLAYLVAFVLIIMGLERIVAGALG